MKIREIMTNLTNLTKVIRKDVDMPFELRRAMRRNYKVLLEEYGLYEEEKIKLKKKLEEGTEEKEVAAELEKILDTEIDIDLIKVSENVLETVVCSTSDEMLLQFMLED